jgi:hypothetical protein
MARTTLISQQAAGTLLNTFTTAKSVINSQAVLQLPPGFFNTIGQVMRVQVMGGISNIVTTPGTITFQIMLNSTPIIVFTSGALQLNATAHTTLPFVFDATLTLVSVGGGTSAAFMGMGTVSGTMFTITAAQVDAVNTTGIFQCPVTAPANGTGFNSTVQNQLDFWAGFSTSNAGNGIQVNQYTVSADL